MSADTSNTPTTADPAAQYRFTPEERRAFVALLIGRGVTTVGTGVVGPFLVIFLVRYRNLNLAVASTVTSAVFAFAVLGGLVVGSLLDRIDWRLVAAGIFALSAAGTGGYAVLHGTASIFATSAVFGLGVGGASALWPTLVGRTFAEQRRRRVFGWDYVNANAALAAGGAVGGFIVAKGTENAFRALFVLDALSFVLCGLVLLAARNVLCPSWHAPPRGEAGATTRVVQRSLLGADRQFLIVVALVALLGVAGYGQFDGVLPAFLDRTTVVTPSLIAVIYVVNAVAIVLGGIVLARPLNRVPDRAGLCLALALIGVSWVFVATTPALGSVPVAAVMVITASIVFALGELLLSRSLPGLVNSLAEQHNRGRYNGRVSMAMSTGRIVGPAASGVVLSGSFALALFPVLAAASLLAAAGAYVLFTRADERSGCGRDVAGGRSG